MLTFISIERSETCGDAYMHASRFPRYCVWHHHAKELPMRKPTPAIVTLLATLVLAATGCDTGHDCPEDPYGDLSTITVELPPTTTTVVEDSLPQQLIMPEGLHFAQLVCRGTCRITVIREDGSNVLRWRELDGELKYDMITLTDRTVRDEVVYFTLTSGSTIELELIQPPSEFTEEPVMILESTSAWYTFGYYAWTIDGDVWKDTSFIGIMGHSTGQVLDYTVMN